MDLKREERATGTFGGADGAEASDAASDREPQVRYLTLPRLQPGTIVNGRYRVEALLGQGGFGLVFSGTDITLKVPVALKFFNPAFLQDGKKFLRVQREINLSRKISDPRIIRIFSLENWAGIWFMVMERVEGRTLKERLKERGRLSWAEFQPMFQEILAGVGSLHAQGIIHRDLKPSNIMVDAGGGVKILDFGLAKEVGDLEKTSSIGEIVGSPYYLSPEQIQGLDLDAASDIYQLGVLLYQALTGAFPFADTTTMGLVLKHLNQRPDPIAAHGVKVPKVVEYVAARSLAKKKQERFRSAAEIAQRLRRGKAPALAAAAARMPRALRMAAIAAAATFLAYAIYTQTIGSMKIAAVQGGGTKITARNRFGRTLWRRDFAPLRVHLAHLAKGHDPATSPDQQNPIRFVNESFLSRLPYLGSPLVFVFLSHPGRGVFPPDASIASTGQDNQLAVLDARGRLLGRDSYARLFGLRPYDFSPVFTMSNFRQAGGRLELFHLQNFQGMYPAAQVALQGTTFSVLCSPGSMQDVRVLADGPDGTRLLVLGANNLVSHLGYLAEMRLVQGSCTTRGVPPNYANDLELEHGAFLAFLPRRCWIVKEEWLARGRVRLLDEQEREAITVYRDGRLEVERDGRVTAYRDDPALLERVYNLVNRFFQQLIARRNPEKALELADAAAALAVRNPYLRSAILCLKGDCEVRLGRFAAGRRSLEEALRLFPRNNDALAKLLETAFLEKGPLAAIALLEGPYSQIENISGLGIGGLLLQGECHLAAGQMEKARECFERIYQENFPDAREALLAQLHLFAGRTDQALGLLRQAEGKVPGFYDVRELRLLLARGMVLAGADPSRCRWILEDLAKFSLRQGHMAEISLCHMLARAGEAAEARARIVPAFARLRSTAAGDLETRLWLWYDAWVYARTMELLGDRAEARAGYRACLEANPHAALAADARRALARL